MDLGSENQNLPGFVVLNGGLIPSGRSGEFRQRFPARHLPGLDLPRRAHPMANIEPAEAKPELQRNKLDLMRRADQCAVERLGREDQVESAIANYELAFRMQSAVPELMDTARRVPGDVRKLYGLDAPYEQTRTVRPAMSGGPATSGARRAVH